MIAFALLIAFVLTLFCEEAIALGQDILKGERSGEIAPQE